MPVVRKAKVREFSVEDEDFIKQLAKDIECHYCKTNDRTYNLNKFGADVEGEMGVFAWVHKKETDSFSVSTRKVWVEEARAKVMAGRHSGLNCFPRDTRLAEDSVVFDTKDGYHKTVSVLKVINKMR